MCPQSPFNVTSLYEIGPRSASEPPRKSTPCGRLLPSPDNLRNIGKKSLATKSNLTDTGAAGSKGSDARIRNPRDWYLFKRLTALPRVWLCRHAHRMSFPFRDSSQRCAVRDSHSPSPWWMASHRVASATGTASIRPCSRSTSSLFTSRKTLSLTPPSTWHKRQFSHRGELVTHGVNRSSHVLSFACDGNQSRFLYGNDGQKMLEEIKSDTHRISRGVRFATEENDRHASARTSPGAGATGGDGRGLTDNRLIPYGASIRTR